jgi:hypothetical protein
MQNQGSGTAGSGCLNFGELVEGCLAKALGMGGIHGLTMTRFLDTVKIKREAGSQRFQLFCPTPREDSGKIQGLTKTFFNAPA